MIPAVAFLSGVIFALGLGVGGMLLPSKVLGFLDVLGHFDPSLAGVMAGGIAVMAVAWRIYERRGRPVLVPKGDLPPRDGPITVRLVVGAAVFGVGWGLGGYCPGPAVVSMVSLEAGVWLHVLGMVAGIGVFRLLDRVTTGQADACLPQRLADG